MVVGGLVLLGHASKTRSGEQARALMAHSDLENCHRKPSFFPSPEAVQYCCAMQGRVGVVGGGAGVVLQGSSAGWGGRVHPAKRSFCLCKVQL